MLHFFFKGKKYTCTKLEELECRIAAGKIWVRIKKGNKIVTVVGLYYRLPVKYGDELFQASDDLSFKEPCKCIISIILTSSGNLTQTRDRDARNYFPFC